MTFAIKLKPEAFVKRRLVTGPIWLELDGSSFPAREWDDFPVAILGFWLTNLKPLLLTQAAECDCPFMDGPYSFYVQIQIDRKDFFSVTPVDRTADDKKFLSTTNVNAHLVVEQLLSASQIVIQTCRRNGWVADDLLTLERLVADYISRPEIKK